MLRALKTTVQSTFKLIDMKKNYAKILCLTGAMISSENNTSFGYIIYTDQLPLTQNQE